MNKKPNLSNDPNQIENPNQPKNQAETKVLSLSGFRERLRVRLQPDDHPPTTPSLALAA